MSTYTITKTNTKYAIFYLKTPMQNVKNNNNHRERNEPKYLSLIAKNGAGTILVVCYKCAATCLSLKRKHKFPELRREKGNYDEVNVERLFNMVRSRETIVPVKNLRIHGVTIGSALIFKQGVI